MTHLQFPESFLERVNKLRRELNEISREVQLMIDGTEAYLMVEGCEINLVERYKINLVELSSNEGAPQENDILLPDTLDVVVAPAEMHDLTRAMLNHDVAGLLSVAMDLAVLKKQQVNAYRRLGAGVTRALSSKWGANLPDSAEDKNTYPRSWDVITKEPPAGNFRLDLLWRWDRRSSPLKEEMFEMVLEGPNKPDLDKVNGDRKKLMDEGVFAFNKFIISTELPT
ncbi:21427_t:CDS:2 [Dentiscutata erythropus]|uniref:21427_t:CDS:1 n=1 Tax=Dentiscutata erythropus TaxID=1348616 RepID=A0A9N9GWR3_9GLOM|nr:21427_t:CDS:2 [Dentiscutata erythropus]